MHKLLALAPKSRLQCLPKRSTAKLSNDFLNICHQNFITHIHQLIVTSFERVLFPNRSAKTAEQCEPLRQGTTNPTRTNITLYFILDGNRKLLFKGKIFVIKNSGTSFARQKKQVQLIQENLHTNRANKKWFKTHSL